MKSVILYASATGARPVYRNEATGGAIYIRAQVIEGDVVEALNRAHPEPGEIILNSVPMPMPGGWEVQAP